jgi:hypothetical protein
VNPMLIFVYYIISGIVKKIVNIAANGVKAENVLPIESAPKYLKSDELDEDTYDSYIKELRDVEENSYFDVPSSAVPSLEF